MPDRQAIQRGLSFEARIGEMSGGTLRPGSGNQWSAQGDVAAGPLLISAKATAKRSWAETRRELKDAVDMSLGTGLLPALAIMDDDDAELVVLHLSDLIDALNGDVGLGVVPSKSDERRKRADTPSYLV